MKKKVSKKNPARDGVVERLISLGLQWPEFMKKLEDRKPILEVTSEHTPSGKRAPINRWHADEYGLVIHYPECLRLFNVGRKGFRDINFSERDSYFLQKCANKFRTVHLWATEHLVCVGFFDQPQVGRANIYNRKTLKLYFEMLGSPLGQICTGIVKGKLELLEKYHLGDGTECILGRIDRKSGELYKVWKGRNGCRCDPTLEPYGQDLFMHEEKILKFCPMCSRGKILNLDTKRSVKFFLNISKGFEKLSVTWFDKENIVAVNCHCNRNDVILAVFLIDTTTGIVELDYIYDGYGDNYVCFCASQDFLVISWRNTANTRDNFTKLYVKDRHTDQKQILRVPKITDNLGQLMLLSGSILVAMPNGTTCPETGLGYERVYTLNLDSEDPEETVLSFKVPVSEVRPIGKDKIICRIEGQDQDQYKVFSIVKSSDD